MTPPSRARCSTSRTASRGAPTRSGGLSLAEHNPAYLDLLNRFHEVISGWDLAAGASVADLGAGTGNFSLALARACPTCRVVHVDASAHMNAVAQRKARALGVRNVEIVTADVRAAPLARNGCAAILSVHALYAMPEPPDVIARMREWLAPGGYIFACDAGRMDGPVRWMAYLVREWACREGMWPAARLLWHARRAGPVNRSIVRAQRQGRFWRHTPAQFRPAFEAMGLEILSASEVYRGTSDLVVARRPIRPAPQEGTALEAPAS